VDFRAGQGAPTRHTGQYGEEAQRRLGSEKAQRVRNLWDRTLVAVYRGEIKAMLGVKTIFGVAVINLMFLGFELVMNVIRTVTG
jgi:hypothetical protein